LSDPLLVATAAAIAVYLVALVAKWPHHALAVAVPLLMWPQLYRVGPLPVQRILEILVIAGLMISSRRSPLPRWLMSAVLALLALLAVSHYAHQASYFVHASEARNSMVAVLLNVLLFVGVARTSPALGMMLKSLSVGAVLFSGYVIAFSDRVGGRVALEGLNPNAAGHAAALGILALTGVVLLTGRKRWLWLVPIPLTLVWLAQSRGGIVVLVVGLAAMWIWSHQGVSRVLAILFGSVAVFSLWGPAASLTQDNLLAERSATFISTDARASVLQVAWRLIEQNPFAGIGYARFPDFSRPEVGVALNTHNEWVRVAVEAGLPTLVLLLFVLAGPLVRRMPPGQAVVVKSMLAAGCASWLFANVMTDLRVALPVWVLARRSRPAMR